MEAEVGRPLLLPVILGTPRGGRASEAVSLLEPSYARRFEKFAKELVWMARVLRYGRENVELA